MATQVQNPELYNFALQFCAKVYVTVARIFASLLHCYINVKILGLLTFFIYLINQILSLTYLRLFSQIKQVPAKQGGKMFNMSHLFIIHKHEFTNEIPG